MIVGAQVFAGRAPARKPPERWPAPCFLRRDDYKLRKRALFRGFEILSRDQPGGPVPELFMRGGGSLHQLPPPLDGRNNN